MTSQPTFYATINYGLITKFLIPSVRKGYCMISPQAEKIAAQCRHYAMCKIDFLGTGICPPGRERHFVSYYPQGRMDIYHALARNMIPVTPGLIDIACSCTLFGTCRKLRLSMR